MFWIKPYQSVLDFIDICDGLVIMSCISENLHIPSASWT